MKSIYFFDNPNSTECLAIKLDKYVEANLLNGSSLYKCRHWFVNTLENKTPQIHISTLHSAPARLVSQSVSQSHK